MYETLRQRHVSLCQLNNLVKLPGYVQMVNSWEIIKLVRSEVMFEVIKCCPVLVCITHIEHTNHVICFYKNQIISNGPLAQETSGR